MSLICVSILANLRDSQFRIESNVSLLDSNRFEHGAGGSIGAFFYSGLPIDSLPRRAKQWVSLNCGLAVWEQL